MSPGFTVFLGLTREWSQSGEEDIGRNKAFGLSSIGRPMPTDVLAVNRLEAWAYVCC
jgi:hypothetical protein